MAASLSSDNIGESDRSESDNDEEQLCIRRASWKTLFGFMTKKHVPVLILGVFTAFISALTLPAMSIFYGLIFREYVGYNSDKMSGTVLLRETSKYCLYLTATTGVNWLANSVYFTMFLTFGELQAFSAREKIFNSLLRREIEWYDMRKNGITVFLTTVQTQIRDLQLSVSAPFGDILQCFVQTSAALGIALYFAWDLTLVIISTMPLIYLAMATLSRRLSSRTYEHTEKLQQALKYVVNAIQNIETIKCLNGEHFEFQRYTKNIKIAGHLYNHQACLRSMQIGFMQLMSLSIFVQGFWYGSNLVVSGKRSPNQVMTTFWAAMQAVQGIAEFMPQLIVLQKGKMAGTKLRALILQSPQNDGDFEREGFQVPSRCSGDVEFKKVSFAYPTRSDQVVINDVSVFFPAGETTFVVGKSGSGKSTLGQLLVRLYEPSSGHIFLDGIPLKHLHSKWLRENITLVEQHSVLFNDTIHRNIAWAKKGGTICLEEIKEAAESVILDQFIQGLPQGYETSIGIQGNALSGGQKQRLALARARIRDTPVLILDESTSALDYIGRAAIFESIRSWRQGKTTIVITHDITQIQPDDFVYVLDKARVTEEGFRKDVESKSESTFGDFLSYSQDYGPDTDSKDNHTNLITVNGAARDTAKPSDRPPSAVFRMLSPLVSPYGRSPLIASQRRLPAESEVLGMPTSPVKSSNRPFSALNTFEERLDYSPQSPASEQPSCSVAYSSSFSQNPARPISSYGTVPPPLARQASNLPLLSSNEKGLSNLEMRPSPVQHESIFAKLSKQTDAPATNHLSIKDVLSTFWPTLGWHSRMILVCAVFCALVHAAATPVFAYVFSQLLSTFYAEVDQQHEAFVYSICIIGIAVIDGSASFGLHYLFDHCAQSWTNALKTQAMSRILMQPREFFDQEENSVSRIAESLNQFAEDARNLPGRFTGIIIVVVAMISIAITWSFIICWKMTIVALASGPILYAITRCYNAISNRWERLSNQADENVGQVLHETFVNIRTIRCLVLEEIFRAKHEHATSSALKVGIKRAVFSGSIFGLNFASVLFVSALLFWYGSYIISRDGFSVTSVIEAFNILLLSINHILFIGSYIPQINISRDAGSRLLRLARLPLDSHELQGFKKIEMAGTVALKDVTFTYPARNDSVVLNNVSFTIPRGSCTAIVGSSGSGKSTIAALLLKLYRTDVRPFEYRVDDLTISNQDISELHTATLRSKMAIVPQNPVIFPGTISDNIAYGLPPSPDHTINGRIRDAAKAAGVADFIQSLSQGYQTVVGEGGSGLSGGQAQRIAIARALIRNPDILILDEATSALDSESAGIIRDTVTRLVMEAKQEESNPQRENMTIIIITHAREMMAIAERIIMLEQGRVVEEGTFGELKRKRKGRFARLLRGESVAIPNM